MISIAPGDWGQVKCIHGIWFRFYVFSGGTVCQRPWTIQLAPVVYRL